jgi:hypothetical protein
VQGYPLRKATNFPKALPTALLSHRRLHTKSDSNYRSRSTSSQPHSCVFASHRMSVGRFCTPPALAGRRIERANPNCILGNHHHSQRSCADVAVCRGVHTCHCEKRTAPFGVAMIPTRTTYRCAAQTIDMDTADGNPTAHPLFPRLIVVEALPGATLMDGPRTDKENAVMVQLHHGPCQSPPKSAPRTNGAPLRICHAM